MTTKHRLRNGQYRIELREKDHLPAHVHLTGGRIDVMMRYRNGDGDGRNMPSRIAHRGAGVGQGSSR